MTHLLLGLKHHFIIREQYIPVSNTPGVIRAAELGIEVNAAQPSHNDTEFKPIGLVP
jgi:hypothetical protein